MKKSLSYNRSTGTHRKCEGMENYKEYSTQVQGWIKEVLHSRGIDAEETLKYCDKIMEYGKEHKSDKLLGFAFYYRAENYYSLNDLDNFFRNITTALPYLDNSEQWELVAKAYNFMGITSFSRGNAPFAMDNYLTALGYCKKYQIHQVGIMINFNIGTMYYNFGDYQQAGRYFDASQETLDRYPDLPARNELYMNTYMAMANTYLAKNQMEKARIYIERAEKAAGPDNMEMTELCMKCLMARFYQAEGKEKLRDECIEAVNHIMEEAFPLLDVFEDLMEYCGMLLEAERFEPLWTALTQMENLAKQAKIHNLQKRILSLKIKYYKVTEDHAGYLQAAGLFYELSEILEKENQVTIGNMLNLRNLIEQSTIQQKQMEEENLELQQKSETDALTGLPNRFRLNAVMEDVFIKANLGKTYFAIEILDIDYFKQYNDNYGHQEGDRCIQAVATAIASMEEHNNVFAARYGGDEFVIVYSGYRQEDVLSMMQELRQRVLGMKIAHGHSVVAPYVSISQGACFGIPSAEDTVSDYLHQADDMLYKVKTMSRNNAGLCEFQKTE